MRPATGRIRLALSASLGGRTCDDDQADTDDLDYRGALVQYEQSEEDSEGGL